MIDKAKIQHHIDESFRAAIAEADGKAQLASQLHAEAKLRLIRMTDEEVWELANITTPDPRSVYSTFIDYKISIKEYITTAYLWLEDLSAIAETQR